MTNPAIVHRDEFQLLDNTRPVGTAPPTAMVAAESRSFIDAYGRTITSPSGYAYRTPVSGDNMGETVTTLNSEAIAIGGTTYQQQLQFSDRTGGPIRHFITLTGTGAGGPLSLMSTGRARDQGTGAGWQPLESMSIGSGTYLTGTTYFQWNPTRDGSGSVAAFYPGVPAYPPLQPVRDRNIQSGQVILYEVSGKSGRTCVIPLNFNNDLTRNPSQVGETQSKSVLAYGWRQLHHLRMNWGVSRVVRATTTRSDYLCYVPTRWNTATCNNQQVLFNRGTASGAGGGYWDEVRLYDLANIGSPFVFPPGYVVQVPSGSGGVDNNRSIQITQQVIQETNAAGVVVNQLTRSPRASDYAAIVLRNSVTDWSYAYIVKLEPLRAQDLLINPFVFVRDKVSNRPTIINFASVWDASDVVGAPIPADEYYGVGVGADSPASERSPGWTGYTDYRSVGLTAHVLAAMQELYESGDMDRTPFDVPPPQTVTNNTTWVTAPLTADRLMTRTRQMWERTRT